MIFESILAVLTSMFSGMSIGKYFNISDMVKKTGLLYNVLALVVGCTHSLVQKVLA